MRIKLYVCAGLCIIGINCQNYRNELNTAIIFAHVVLSLLGQT
jgi:hypothetical protein